MSNKNGLMLIFFSALVFGWEGIFVQLCYDAGFNENSFLVMKMFVAAILCGLICLMRRKPLLFPSGKRHIAIILGLFFAGISFCLYRAFALLPAALAMLFFYSYPAFCLVFSFLFTKNKIRKNNIIAIVMAFCGLILLYFSSLSLKISVYGMLFGITAGFFMAIYVLLMEKYASQIETFSLNANLFFVSGVATLVFSLFQGNLQYSGIAPQGFLLAVVFIVCVDILANVLFTFGMIKAPAVEASLLSVVEAPATALYAYFVFGNSFTWQQCIGGALIIFAAIFPNLLEKFSQKH